MPSPRAAGGAAEVDGRLFVAGGAGPDGALVEDVVVFDPDTRAWTVQSGPPTAREHLGVAGHDGELFVVGGRTGGIGANLDAAEALDVAAGSWRARPHADGARRRRDGDLERLRRLAGGEADATFDEAEAYDVRAAGWRCPSCRRLATGSASWRWGRLCTWSQAAPSRSLGLRRGGDDRPEPAPVRRGRDRRMT